MKNARTPLDESLWVDDLMKTLQPDRAFSPDPARALSRLRERTQSRKILRGWTWTTAAVSVTACFALFVLPTRGTCAQRLWGSACENPAVARALPVAPAAAVTTPPLTATIVCEIYSDYECPYCARFFLETLPLLEARYEKNGRVKIVHRDFPLPQHPWAKVAARYANAAGQLGEYQLVASQIFRTQQEWSGNGDVDTQVARVLPPATMLKLREIVRNGQQPGDSIAHDAAMAAGDRINQTPSMVVVTEGKRVVIAPIPSFAVLSAYIDELLAKH